MRPAARCIVLPSNCPPNRFYRGGRKIRTFRGEDVGAERQPEDWIGSTTTVAGEEELGLTRLPDGERLIDAIAADPEWWLGERHLERFGVDTKLLVKLLDAGERLPVHAHPSLAFASTHLGRPHGKAEAWFMLTGGQIHLGLRQSVGLDALERLVVEQRTNDLLELLHVVEVGAGDVAYVPPGTLHAIGAGVFLVEIQEPEDLSIILEWDGFELDGAGDGHLGLGFDVALQAVDRRRLDAGGLTSLVGTAGFGESVLPPGASEYFRLERRRIDGSSELEPGFAILIVIDGVAQLGHGASLPAHTRAVALYPHAVGPIEIQGTVEVVICRPPA